MKVFMNYTLRSLLRSRSRTVVTLIGIILSMALFTAVIESVYSGIQFMISAEKEMVGSRNGAAVGISEKQAKALAEDRDVLRTGSVRSSGLSHLTMGEGEDENELVLAEICEEYFPEMMGIRLKSGRLPENDSEVLLPVGMVFGHEPGDTVVSSAGKTLTVTGVFEQSSSMVGRYIGDSFAFTGPAASPSIGLRITLFELKDPGKFERFLSSHSDMGEVVPNVELLQYYGYDGGFGVLSLLDGFAGVLVALVVFGSVALIYNSFAISVNERTKQYGILKSVGATRFQIRFCVFYEAFLLCLIGIPLGMLVGCLGIGITFYALGGAFRSLFGEEFSSQLKLVVNARPLLMSALISLLTAMAAAFIPSVRAVRISPIEAIRQTKDVKLKTKRLKVNPLTQKIFGFAGLLAVKSMKRSRRQYRAITISLFMSIVLFVGASAFCDYLEESTGSTTAFSAEADILVEYYSADQAELDRLKKDIGKIPGVEEVSYCTIIGNVSTVYLPISAMDDSFRDVLSGSDADSVGYHNSGSIGYTDANGNTDEEYFWTYVTFAFLDDAAFRQILKAGGLKAEDYFDPENPRGIALNDVASMDYDWEARKTVWSSYRVLDRKALPAEGFAETQLDLEGYVYEGQYTKPDGSVWEAYVAEADLEKFYEGSEKPDFEPDWSVARLFTPEEAMVKDTFAITALSSETVSSIPRSQFTLLFPYSLLSGQEAFSFTRQPDGVLRSVFGITSQGFTDVGDEVEELIKNNYSEAYWLNNQAKALEQVRMLILVIHVFAYGFIILISLIAAANVFNTISTGIMLRRREFAMLKSVGLADRGILKILNYECLICGLRSLIIGLPVSILLCWVIYKAVGSVLLGYFYVPWYSVAIAAGSVFVVVFASMLYAAGKLRKDNVIDAIKREV